MLIVRCEVVPLEYKELKVAKNTEPKKLAGTIRHYLSAGTACKVLALGQQPICVGVKAIALLTSMFNTEYQCKISYFNQRTSGGDLAGIQFELKCK